MLETVRVVGKYYAIDGNRNIVAQGNSWEEVEEIMKKKGYKRSQYYILTVVEAGKSWYVLLHRKSLHYPKRLRGTITVSGDRMPKNRREPIYSRPAR
ncbi:MAG: hypothetical protein JHC26_12060 [Thermofilum sp.]|uniref:hypothetical protein n=1 Tax=Thermofilum sp. TaxID=1961369 RepID=UPI00258B5D7E|nr:hypothetical protein [Thermofilum sp.]MCI4409819.1 hypothetical protein [Thermofilum sp.]